jgi:pantothenate kinase type III
LIGAITHFQDIQSEKLSVVDFGSCTTLTTIAKTESGWKYMDGFIQCGISAMGQSLHKINEALPSISAKIMREYLVKFDETVPPSSTERNIVKGVIRSSQALIKGLSAEGHSVIVTGGWSLPLEKFIKGIDSSVHIIPDLIVRGGIEYFKLFE